MGLLPVVLGGMAHLGGALHEEAGCDLEPQAACRMGHRGQRPHHELPLADALFAGQVRLRQQRGDGSFAQAASERESEVGGFAEHEHRY